MNSTYNCLAICFITLLKLIQNVPTLATESEAALPSSEVENFPNVSTVATELESEAFSLSARDLLPLSVVAEPESLLPSLSLEDSQPVSPVAAESKSDNPSPYGGDIWTRSGLTGDWGGERSLLYNNGLDININLIQYYQGVVSGGEKQEDTYFGVAEYRMIVDTEKAQLWPNGITVVQGETYFGETIDDSVGALLSARHRYAVQAGAGNGTYLTFFNHTQKFSDTFSLTFGKMPFPGGDVNDFAFGIGDIQFLNIALQQNPVNLILAGYSALGTTLTFTPTENVTLKISAYEADRLMTKSTKKISCESSVYYIVSVAIKNCVKTGSVYPRISIIG